MIVIEVVFSENAQGSLKLAQHFGVDKYLGGAVSVIIRHADGREATAAERKAALEKAKAREKHEWETAIPLGGNPQDVLCLNAAWSMGDISDLQIGEGRKNALEQLYSFWPSGEDIPQKIEERLWANRNTLQTVLDRSSKGEAVRIWYSHSPEELCGFTWLLTQLSSLKSHGPIYSVLLPDWEYGEENTVVSYRDWGEMSPGKWGHFLSLQQQVQPALLTACAMEWKKLQRENAPLRVFLNGSLQSAPETIYDSFILQELEAQPQEFSEAMAIGQILGRHPLGIGADWIALRIQKWIRQGKLEVRSTPDPDQFQYQQTLRKLGW